jgi:glutamate carboxypeptidase
MGSVPLEEYWPMQHGTDFAEAQSLVPSFLEDLRALVDIDSGTYTPSGVLRVAEYLRPSFIELGFDVEMRPGQRLGPQMIARRGVPGGAHILLIGHMDTVYPDGAASLRPFRIEGDRAVGPGVFDMKSGLLVGIYALRVLAAARESPAASMTFLCNSDEEVGSPESGPLIRELARDADAAIVLEPTNAPDEVKVARKGVGTYTLEVRGLAAHAGVEPEKGRSAILQLAHLIVAAHAINGTIPGVSVNVGVIAGGERPNVVADFASAQIDVRAASSEGAQAVDEALRSAIAVSCVSDTTSSLTGGFAHQPFQQSEASARLFSLAKDAASEVGVSLRGVFSGGGSDGNTTAAMGIPTIDGMGLSGGLAHNPGEWISIASIAPRIATLAGLLHRLETTKEIGA